MPNTKNADQARLDRLIAQGGSPTAIKNLQKKLGVSTVPGSTNTPDNGLTTDQSQFEQGWKDYIKASKGVYDIETQRTLDTYQQKQDQYALQAQRNKEDYARYTSNAQTQMNRQLASASKDFARKLASASSAYGQRGILRSGIAKSQIGEATSDYLDEKTYFKTESQRQIEEQQQAYNRQLQDITTAQGQLDTQKGQYIGDRAVGSKILENTLQYQGDIQYNTLQSQKWATEQDRLRQEAKNKAAGIVSTPSLRTWRSGGIYTAS